LLAVQSQHPFLVTMVAVHDQSVTGTVEEKKGNAFDEVEKIQNNLQSNGHAVGNALLVGNDGHLRKVPVPSENPNDPLNFLPRQKYGVILVCCWFCKLPLKLAFNWERADMYKFSYHVSLLIRGLGSNPQRFLRELHPARAYYGRGGISIDIPCFVHWSW
jgi:hypothetical protein